MRWTNLKVFGFIPGMPSFHSGADESQVLVSRVTGHLSELFHEGAYFEGKVRVVHVQAASGMGGELKPHCQSVLQKWILLAMRSQPSESASLD
jgi:hypothetical protein